MADEARNLEPVRMFDDLGDQRANMKDFGPRLERMPGVEPTAEPLNRDNPNAPGYDPEHRVWVNEQARQEYLNSLTHPLDADEEHPASNDPPTEAELVSTAAGAEPPKGKGTPAAS